MIQLILIGLGAGVATALLFASVASGALLSIFLFYLAPLPILIAALGWSHWAALIAAVSAAAGLAAVLSPFFFITFLVGIGLPAWWLGYLALLARAAPGAADQMEWYPVGRIVVWAAILGALVVIAAIPNFGLDEESFRSGLRDVFERMLRAQTRNAADGPLSVPGVDTTKLVNFLVAVIPLAGAVLATITSILNLWLAARIVKVSGLLKRPWPNLPDMQFPPFAPALLAVAIAGTFLPGIAGTIASILSASLSMAYGILGFAVLHSITRTARARPLLLGTSYAAVVVFGWPVLLVAMLGLADTIFSFRGRGAGHPPPAPRT
jgi:Predicted membrane protein (DUF2232)